MKTFNKEWIDGLERRLGSWALMGIVVISFLNAIIYACALLFRFTGLHVSEAIYHYPIRLLVCLFVDWSVILLFSLTLRTWLKKGGVSGREVLKSLVYTFVLAFILICVFGTWDLSNGLYERPYVQLNFFSFHAKTFLDVSIHGGIHNGQTFSALKTIWSNMRCFIFDCLFRGPGIITWVFISFVLRWESGWFNNDSHSKRI